MAESAQFSPAHCLLPRSTSHTVPDDRAGRFHVVQHSARFRGWPADFGICRRRQLRSPARGYGDVFGELICREANHAAVPRRPRPARPPPPPPPPPPRHPPHRHLPRPPPPRHFPPPTCLPHPQQRPLLVSTPRAPPLRGRRRAIALAQHNRPLSMT